MILSPLEVAGKNQEIYFKPSSVQFSHFKKCLPISKACYLQILRHNLLPIQLIKNTEKVKYLYHVKAKILISHINDGIKCNNDL